MNRLVFYYGAMNSGKSLQLLAFAAKLRNKNIPYLVVKPSTDTRDGAYISSRPLDEKLPCLLWKPDEWFDTNELYKIKYILIDEAQFMTSRQVAYLAAIVDSDAFDITIVCYGLRTDFRTQLFEGSKRLFELADEIHEIDDKDIDAQGNKVIINARIVDGKVTLEGPQVVIGAEDKYLSMSRKEFYKKLPDKL